MLRKFVVKNHYNHLVMQKNRASVFEWHKRLKEGRESVRDDERCSISTRTMQQFTTPSLSQTIWPRWASTQLLSLPTVQTLLPMTFAYSLSSEAVVMRQLRRWKRLWWRSLTHSHKRTSMGPSRSCWNCTASALQVEEITLKGIRVSCVYYAKESFYIKFMFDWNTWNHSLVSE